MSAKYQVLIYVEDDEGDPYPLALFGEKVPIPVFDIEPAPHPTLGHSFQLPPALREWLAQQEVLRGVVHETR